MAKGAWLIYGATGYTGRLIAEEAVRRGETPLLGGRNKNSIEELANRLGLSSRCFGLTDVSQVQDALSQIKLVLNCAGPFSQTAPMVLEACLKVGAHYLDITGEIDVFEYIFAKTSQAKSSGVIWVPGVGFDVVPSDCLAAKLGSKMPNATFLELAFAGAQGVSPGTLKTMVENLPTGGRIRNNGDIIRVPFAHRTKLIPFSHRSLHSAAIPWGDVSTAYHSTAIPNITVYVALPKSFILMAKSIGYLAPALHHNRVKAIVRGWIEKHVKGPDENLRNIGRSYLWGKVADREGNELQATLETQEGYALTVLTSLGAVERVLSGSIQPGVWTPSQAFGSDFITQISGSSFQFLESMV